jgi:hypothetical protein
LSKKDLKREVGKKLGITRQGVEWRAKKIKRSHGPMSTSDAICWIAVEEGLDLSKYLDQPGVDRIRQLMRTQPPPSVSSRGGRSTSRAAPAHVIIGGRVQATDPLLAKKVFDDVKLMAGRVYPLLYLLENSVRELIQRVLRHSHGDEWWSNAVPQGVRTLVQGRMEQEKKKRWHGRRNAHEIYYTDIDDLKSIVISNWDKFAGLFDQDWFKVVVEQLTISRNVVAHNNPLGPDDIRRVEVHCSDWHKQIKGVRHLIP